MGHSVLYLDENDQSFRWNSFLLRLSGVTVVEFFNRDELQNWFVNVQFSGGEHQFILLIGYLNTTLQADTFMNFLAAVKEQLTIVQLEMEDVGAYSTAHVDSLRNYAETVSCSIESVRSILLNLDDKQPGSISIAS